MKHLVAFEVHQGRGVATLAGKEELINAQHLGAGLVLHLRPPQTEVALIPPLPRLKR